MTKAIALLGVLSCVAVLGGCATETGELDDRGPESELPVEGATDTFSRPTEHGVLALGTSSARLASTARFHAWTVGLGGCSGRSCRADVTIATRGGTGLGLDTVLYVYRRQADGRWGTYIARNDNAHSRTRTSLVSQSFGPGEYRVLVKGYRTHTYGDFALDFECSGSACPVVPTSGCDASQALATFARTTCSGAACSRTIAGMATAQQENVIACCESWARQPGTAPTQAARFCPARERTAELYDCLDVAAAYRACADADFEDEACGSWLSYEDTTADEDCCVLWQAHGIDAVDWCG